MDSEQLSSTYVSPAAILEHERLNKTERRTASIFGHVAFITALCLQRFGLPLGSGSTLSASLPVLWLLVGWMLLSGRARFYVPATVAFMVFGSWALLAAVCSVIFPSPDSGFSLFSLIGVLLTYGFLMLRPIAAFRGDIVKNIFFFYARLCAGLGIIQFCAQFAHLKLFSFGQIMPFLRPILLERFFNTSAPVAYGSSTFRSNGFFLIEPSTFSQVMAIVIILDFFVMGRKRWLPLYLLAYMVSFSGTGLLSFVITLAFMSLTSGKTLMRMILMGIAAMFTGAMFALVLPKEFSNFTGRFGELTTKGTSGNARYLSGLDQIQYYLGDVRGLLGYGSGATTHSLHYVEGSGNSGFHILIDYGLVGLIAFFVFLAIAVWRRGYAPLCLFFLVDFELGGDLLLFAPYALLMCALVIWGGNRNAPQLGGAVQVRRAPRASMSGPALSPS